MTPDIQISQAPLRGASKWWEEMKKKEKQKDVVTREREAELETQR